MRFLHIALLALFAGAPLEAQAVLITGAERDTTVAKLEALIGRGSYRVIDRDTLFEPGSFVGGDLIVLRARVALAGTVNGSVAVIGGDLFIRPSATVHGEILDFGTAYPSGLAAVAAISKPEFGLRSEVVPSGGDYLVTLVPPASAGLVRLPATFGFALPTYDRVDGAAFGWSGELGLGGDTAAVSLIGGVGYATARERLTGGLELRLRPTPTSYVSLRASRAKRTRERWIRSDFANSASSLVTHSDVRNYFESDEAVLSISTLPPPPLIQGERYIVPRAGVRASDDRSLENADPWTLFDRDAPWRPNPRIDEGRLVSTFAGLSGGWQGITARFGGDAAVEWAPGGAGDFEFAQLTASADWSMVGLRGHQLQTTGYLLMPLSGSVPRQRWSSVGGPGTLRTLPLDAMRGDHLLFVHSTYLLAIPRVVLPLVGPPSLRLEYSAGGAWATGNERPDLEQNIGAGIQLRMVSATFHFNPAEEPRRGVFSFGIELPGSRGTSRENRF